VGRLGALAVEGLDPTVALELQTVEALAVRAEGLHDVGSERWAGR